MRTYAHEPPKPLHRSADPYARIRRWGSSRAENPVAGGLHDFSRLSVHTCSAPVSVGSSDKAPEPFGEYNEEGLEGGEGLAVAALDEADEGPAVPAAAVVPPAPAPAPAPRTVIRGPREMWNFNREAPAGYDVSAQLSTNRSGGVFAWSTSPQLTLSSATDPRPTVTTALPSVVPGRDAWIRVRHTDPGGGRTAASYRLTIRAPESLTHLNDVDTATAGLGYTSEIHYSIHDQFGTVLPRNVPLNEQFTGPAVQDFPGGNWTRPPQCGAAGVCGASFNPANFFDQVTGEGDAGAVPAPVAPTHPAAAVAAEHWPGDWFIGGQVPGTGRRVRTVTWQRNRGFARHT
jgi:hypothetical protein